MDQNIPRKVFFNNYDTYEASSGPGAGWHSMHKYKSIKDFLKAKRKRKKAQALRMRFFKKVLAENFNGSIGLTGYYPNNDIEDKTPDKLNFSQNYVDSNIKKIKSKPLAPSPAPLLGMPDGVEEEEKDADKTKNKQNPYYGTTNLHNLTYEKL